MFSIMILTVPARKGGKGGVRKGLAGVLAGYKVVGYSNPRLCFKELH